MIKLEQFKEDIASLDPKDVQKLADWLDEYRNELWDRQIESDSKAGKLDVLTDQVLADHKAGKTKPL